MIPDAMNEAWLRDAERRLERLLCAITGRLNPNREHKLPPAKAALAEADLDQRIRAGARDLRDFLA